MGRPCFNIKKAKRRKAVIDLIVIQRSMYEDATY